MKLLSLIRLEILESVFYDFYEGFFPSHIGKNGKQKSMENQPVIEDKPEGSEISLFGMKEFMWG